MRWRTLFFAMVIAAVAAWLSYQPPGSVPVPRAVAPSAAPAAPPPVAAAVPEPAPVQVAAADPAPGPVNFASGFCPNPNEVDAFMPRFSLRKLAEAPGTSASLRSALGDYATAETPGETLEALRRARALAPNDPAIAWGIASLTRDGAALDETIDALSVYLAHDAAPALSRLRARLEVQRDIQRDYKRDERNGVTVLWPADLMSNKQAQDVQLLVDRALDEAAQLTLTKRRKALTVVVYPSKSELLAVSCVATWSAALYDGTLRVIGGPNGVEVKTVRHETLHAQLSPNATSAPKWFHEGVAQSFAQQDLRARTWPLMVRNQTWLPFSSLDGSFQVFDGNDAELAYAQSYAMVEMMRHERGDGAIATAVAAFQQGAGTEVALSRVFGRDITGRDLLEFIGKRLAR